MNTNAESKYDYITSKNLITSGSPTRYQLTPKKSHFGTLKRITLGKKNPEKMNKTILLVGETGAGKSTLINTLVNYAIGVDFDDNIWFEIVEEKKTSQTESQTSDVIVYEIFGFEDQTLPYSLTIIDTPGFGNTRGFDHDVIVNQRLLDLFRSEGGVHEIDVVGLVVKASESRFSDRLSYIFNSVVSLFGKDLEENIVALITNSNGRKPKNALEALETADVKCATNEKNEPVHFLFDNCLNEDRTEDIEDLKHANKTTLKGMNQFTDFLEKTAPQQLKKTVDVLNERIRLTACIHNLEDRIKLIKLKQEEIKQTQESLTKYEQEMKNNENFTIEVNEVYKEAEPIESWEWFSVFKGAVCCTKCEENCHYPGCTMAITPSWCEVMKDGRCTVCTSKCPVTDHVKENWKFVTNTRKVKRTQQEVKEKYDKNKAESEKTTGLLENLEKELEKLEANKTQLLDEAYQHTMNLETIALNVYSLSTYVHLDFLIEEMGEKEENTEKVQKLKQMTSLTNKGLQAGLQYMLSKVCQIFKRNKGDKKGTEV